MTSEHPSRNTIDSCTGSTFPIWRSTYQQPLGSIYTRSFHYLVPLKQNHHLGNRSDPDTLGGKFFLDLDFTTEKGNQNASGHRCKGYHALKPNSKFTPWKSIAWKMNFPCGRQKGPIFRGKLAERVTRLYHFSHKKPAVFGALWGEFFLLFGTSFGRHLSVLGIKKLLVNW